MPITSLKINNFRNLAAIELAPTVKQLNVISGLNGSGKTSLLEAIYYLGHGRSFRTNQLSNLTRHFSDNFSIISQIVTDTSRTIPIGVERNIDGRSQLRMNETNASNISEIASLLPIRLINSQSHQLFESGPLYRRKFLDWGLFYYAENFLPCWRQYDRTLKQRNIVLRDNKPKRELDVWTVELVKYAKEFDQIRRNYVEEFSPLLSAMTNELLGIDQLEIHYRPGWDESMELEDVFAEKYREEYGCGYTLLGPHRADLEIDITGIPVKHFLSRGQQKLLICAMILAQGMLLAKKKKTGLIYLVDDLPSELDTKNRDKLISLFTKQESQIFITAIESEAICDLMQDKPNVFHVEHGTIRTQLM